MSKRPAWYPNAMIMRVLPAAVAGFLLIAAMPHSRHVSVTVTVGTPLASVAPDAIGLNTAVWDWQLQDGPVPGRIRAAHVDVLRFPGGSTSDTYHWADNSITPGQQGGVDPSNTFDAFMAHIVRPTHSQAIVTVNYGSNQDGTGGGDPAEAAAWVRHANIEMHDNVRYWEIGNEVYGNGYYGAHWETDLHADHSPTAYARNALQFIAAMKAADPTIKVGLVLTAPGNWPDGQGPEQWNPTVLSIACSQADFVIVHWYPQNPGSESDAGLLAAPDGIAGMVSQLRAELTQYCGSHAQDVGIMVTETNSVSSNPGKQTTNGVNALFLLEDYTAWLQSGVESVDWWDLHDSVFAGNSSRRLAGKRTYGNYGVLSSGAGPEPAEDKPYPTYDALQMLGIALPPGATFLQTHAGSSSLWAAALRRPDGSLALILVNRGRTSPATVTPHVAGVRVRSASLTILRVSHPVPVTHRLRPHHGAVTFALPPYAGAVVTLHG